MPTIVPIMRGKNQGKKRVKRSVAGSQKYSGIVKATKDFVTSRYNHIFSGKTIDEVLDILTEFTNGEDSKLLEEGKKYFIQFLIEREKIAQDFSSQNYNNYRKAIINLESKAEELMNHFRGYFNSFNTNTNIGDRNNANELIYLFATNNERNKQIQIAFTDFKTMLHNELNQGLSLYANSNTILSQFKSDRFSTSVSSSQNTELMNKIGLDRINNIQYFLNRVINKEEGYTGDMTGVKEFQDDSIITQIRRIIQVGDTYKGKDGYQTVTSARVVDVLLGGDRLEKVANGQWYTEGGNKGVLDDLKEYVAGIKKQTGIRKEDYLSKMLGENRPGVLEGDARNFIGGAYDVQIKTQLDGNMGFGMISTNALASSWIMFSNPFLLASIISDEITDGKELSPNDQAAMQLWAEDTIGQIMQSENPEAEGYSEENIQTELNNFFEEFFGSEE